MIFNFWMYCTYFRAHKLVSFGTHLGIGFDTYCTHLKFALLKHNIRLHYNSTQIQLSVHHSQATKINHSEHLNDGFERANDDWNIWLELW